MKLSICVGSSCHLKGSYEVIEKLKQIVKTYGVEDKLELCASFCLGHCSDGVSAKLDEELITGLNPNNVEDVFLEQIMPKIK
ncbi:MAG: NAD(P)H-dependent oxidoreductase subunit E [Eubacteriales bacterium]|nr:NAD(P)H-dependent oxidoreductase subunit E [Eubacteriales bacterium]